jgi:hypothetical protein
MLDFCDFGNGFITLIPNNQRKKRKNCAKRKKTFKKRKIIA